jgi:hypothetical protein
VKVLDVRICSKVRFRCRRDAEQALQAIYIKRRQAQRKVPKRCYFCDLCHAWHLTSWERR